MTSKLWQARFFTSANQPKDFPNISVPEVAFVGRSNAGKSSAINVLCNQKKLAFASKTPGRTQHINFYSIGGAHVAQHRKDPTDQNKIEFFLTDLPGYGFAQVSGSAKTHWRDFLSRYLIERQQLAGLILVMDARRPFEELDIDLIEWFIATGKPIHCLLTKADKLNKQASINVLKQAQTILSRYITENGKPFPFSAQLFSATNRIGIDEADKKIFSLLNNTF